MVQNQTQCSIKLRWILGLLFGVAASVPCFGQAARVVTPNPKGARKIVYPEKSQVDFDGMAIQGEIKNPGELYFKRQAEEPKDSLLKKRTQFHQEMLRDVMRSK